MRTTNEELIRAKLQPGEQVIWSGQPDAKRMLLNYVLPGWGFIAIAAVAFVLTGVDIGLVGIFTLIASGVILGMGALVVYPEARRTFYVLTDRRALIFGTGRTSLTQEFQASDIGPIQRFERSDGSGDLFFASEVYRKSRRRLKSGAFGFIGIADVRTVEQHLRDVLSPDSTGQQKPDTT